MAGERDLGRLLAALDPVLREGEYVFVSLRGGPPAQSDPVASVREPEATTYVLERAQADAAGLSYDFVAAWIMLTVHSALDAVGLTAAVATRLADAGISCNVVAGACHDHLFVPADRARAALAALASAPHSGTAGTAGALRADTRLGTGSGLGPARAPSVE